MTIERSHGKHRPTLPRASDLQPAPSAAQPTGGRGPDGRFAVGNRQSVGAGVKATFKKLLGPKVGGPEGQIIRRDAWRVFTATIVTMASDVAPVRAMVSLYAGHVALAGYYRAAAAEKGLDTPEGLKLLEVADRQSQRAERTLVTAHDVARVHAERTGKRKPNPWITLPETNE